MNTRAEGQGRAGRSEAWRGGGVQNKDSCTVASTTMPMTTNAGGVLLVKRSLPGKNAAYRSVPAFDGMRGLRPFEYGVTCLKRKHR